MVRRGVVIWGYDYRMKKLRQTYHIRALPGRVWKALVDANEIEEWGGGPAKMDSQVGTEFELWGGDVHGVNTEVVKEKKLVQDWTEGDWPEPSRVSFTIEAEESGTKLVLDQEKIPDDDFEDIRNGWKEYYLGPMKEYLERT